MALVQKSNTKRTIILVAVMVAIIIGGSAFYYLSGRPPGADLTSDVTIQQEQIPTDFGAELLHTPAVTGLRSFGNIPVSDDPGTGNPSPFGGQ